MTTKNTGGPAFPLPVADQDCCGRFESGYGGMTLRDYFAAKAMQGEVAANTSKRADPTETAEYAYQMADAMLRAREGK